MSGPTRDPSSNLPLPPRALTGNQPWPVLGHTMLFHKFGGNIAYLFPPNWREWRWLPWSRKLGEIYSIFVWGQWNIVIKGSERVKTVILESDLSEGWPYGTAPVALLGKSCPAFLDQEEANCLRNMISMPLCQMSVVKHAPRFAEIAYQCIDDIMAGYFNNKGETKLSLQNILWESPSKADDEAINTSDSQSSSDSGDKVHKIKLDALRSYTLKLMDGPVLNMEKFQNDTQKGSFLLKDNDGGNLDDGERTVRFEENRNEANGEDEIPGEEMFLLWMDRLKTGLCGVKFTFGPEWMQIWRLNPYGRALNARQKLERIVEAHVEERSKLVPVLHEKGRSTRDPFTSPLPLLKFTENYFFRNEDPVMGTKSSKIQNGNRARTSSEPGLAQNDESKLNPRKVHASPRGRTRSESDAIGIDKPVSSPKRTPSSKKINSILDEILREADFEGRGITQYATTEISLLLWMMMDAGQAWTAMAINLLSNHDDACREVQSEIDRLDRTYGKDRLFTSFVLGKMEKLDNLIFEAIRFSPAFLGGIKLLNQTVELDGVQIPKNSNIFLCNPHDDATFTIDYPTPKRPEDIGSSYPSVDLYGFLPLQGLEIPLMVLQTKVFLIALLQNYSPLMLRRMTLMKRFQSAINKSMRHVRTSSKEMGDTIYGNITRSKSADRLDSLERGKSDLTETETTPQTSREKIIEMHQRKEQRFSRVPFPEPLRSIRIRQRPDRDIFETPLKQ